MLHGVPMHRDRFWQNRASLVSRSLSAKSNPSTKMRRPSLRMCQRRSTAQPSHRAVPNSFSTPPAFRSSRVKMISPFFPSACSLLQPNSFFAPLLQNVIKLSSSRSIAYCFLPLRQAAGIAPCEMFCRCGLDNVFFLEPLYVSHRDRRSIACSPATTSKKRSLSIFFKRRFL